MGACFNPNDSYDNNFEVATWNWDEDTKTLVEKRLPVYKAIISELRDKYNWFEDILKLAGVDADIKYITEAVMCNWLYEDYVPGRGDEINWPNEIIKTLNGVDFLKVLKIIGHDILFDIKKMLDSHIDYSIIKYRILSSEKYVSFKDYHVPVSWLIEQIAKMQDDEWQQINNSRNTVINNFKNKATEASAAKDFNPNAFLEKPVVQQNIMQPQAPQQVQQPVYQAPQPQQQTPQSVVLHPQCRPANNVQILNYVPINPMEYDGFYGLFMDQLNNQVYLPVARPRYSNIESGFGCLLDDNNNNNDTTKIVEYLRKHVKFINPGKNNFTLTEVLSLINLVKNNAKVREYCEKYESIYNPSSIILNEVTDKYILSGTKYNKAFSIDTQDANHPIIVFYNTKPYYNGIINGWINESAITVKK